MTEQDEIIERIKARYPDKPLHIYLAALNEMAKGFGIHISSEEDLLLKIDGVVVAHLYYDATEQHYSIQNMIKE